MQTKRQELTHQLDLYDNAFADRIISCQQYLNYHVCNLFGKTIIRGITRDRNFDPR